MKITVSVPPDVGVIMLPQIEATPIPLSEERQLRTRLERKDIADQRYEVERFSPPPQIALAQAGASIGDPTALTQRPTQGLVDLDDPGLVVNFVY